MSKFLVFLSDMLFMQQLQFVFLSLIAAYIAVYILEACHFLLANTDFYFIFLVEDFQLHLSRFQRLTE